MNTIATHALEFDSRLEATAAAATELRDWCARVGVAEAELMMIELCLVEAMNNAVEHGCGNESGQRIEATGRLDGNRLELCVRGPGEAMDGDLFEATPSGFEDPDPDDLATWDDRGRGITIIKSVMDSVEYSHEDGLSCITMGKDVMLEDAGGTA
ncbi:MAG: ATP-binding protein [Gammaproteobacteria bacterium]